MRRVLVLALLAASAVQAQPADSVAWGVPPGWADWQRASLAELDSTVGAAAGLAPLADTPLPAGSREIRIWVEESFASSSLHRFVEHDGDVTGEAWTYWDADGPDSTREQQPGESDFDLTLFYLGRACEAVRSGPGRYGGRLGVCQLAFTSPPDWQDLLRQAEAVGVWSLPDETEASDERIVGFDGATYTVEARDGRRYRVYSYWSPYPSRGPAFAAADSLFRLVGQTVWSRVVNPGTDRVYRGIYTVLRDSSGDRRSLFQPCGSGDVWELRGLTSSDHLATPAVVTVSGTLEPEWAARIHEQPYRGLSRRAVLSAEPWDGQPCAAP